MMLEVREVNALLGIVALGLILWRTISTWPELRPITRALALLLAALLTVGALGSWSLSRAYVRETELTLTVSYCLLVVRSVVVLTCLSWTQLLHQPGGRLRR